jgi:hypothetical protein
MVAITYPHTLHSNEAPQESSGTSFKSTVELPVIPGALLKAQLRERIQNDRSPMTVSINKPKLSHLQNVITGTRKKFKESYTNSEFTITLRHPEFSPGQLNSFQVELFQVNPAQKIMSFNPQFIIPEFKGGNWVLKVQAHQTALKQEECYSIHKRSDRMGENILNFDKLKRSLHVTIDDGSFRYSFSCEVFCIAEQAFNKHLKVYLTDPEKISALSEMLWSLPPPQHSFVPSVPIKQEEQNTKSQTLKKRVRPHRRLLEKTPLRPVQSFSNRVSMSPPLRPMLERYPSFPHSCRNLCFDQPMVETTSYPAQQRMQAHVPYPTEYQGNAHPVPASYNHYRSPAVVQTQPNIQFQPNVQVRGPIFHVTNPNFQIQPNVQEQIQQDYQVFPTIPPPEYVPENLTFQPVSRRPSSQNGKRRRESMTDQDSYRKKMRVSLSLDRSSLSLNGPTDDWERFMNEDWSNSPDEESERLRTEL